MLTSNNMITIYLVSFPFILVRGILKHVKCFCLFELRHQHRTATISEISNISGVSRAVRVSGVYDIVAKVSEESGRIYQDQ